MSKYGVYSGRYIPVYGLNTEIYGPEKLLIWTLFTQSSELHSFSIKTEIMQQIGINICNLPEADGLKHLVVCINYFSKWSKPIKDKRASTITEFLFEIINRHGCIKTQINYQGREFVNEVSKVLHNMIGTEQHITLAYNPQLNGLCERRNRTTKDSLVKVHDGNPCDWPNITVTVLFTTFKVVP